MRLGAKTGGQNLEVPDATIAKIHSNVSKLGVPDWCMFFSLAGRGGASTGVKFRRLECSRGGQNQVKGRRNNCETIRGKIDALGACGCRLVHVFATAEARDPVWWGQICLLVEEWVSFGTFEEEGFNCKPQWHAPGKLLWCGAPLPFNHTEDVD